MTDCEAAHAPIPTFQYHLSGFGVEFSFKTSEKSESVSEKSENMSEKSESVSEKNESMSEKSKSMSEKSEDIFEKKIAVLTFMKENPKITARQIAILLSVSPKTVERFIKQLKEMNQIRRKRGKKGGEWELIVE
jgi:predicted HTH transcriptional regulator